MNEIFILTGYVFLVLFLILCLYKIYVALDAQLRASPCSLKKKQNKKTLYIKSDLISSKYVYSQLTIKDCSSSRFRESTSITRHNGFSAHHDSLTTKMLDHGVTKKSSPPHPPPPLPLPCSNTAYWQIYLYVFLVSVCSSIYPGLHQNSIKVNSQGQASGRSFNRGSSIMAPASAQLTLTEAQEKEDNSSQEQAAKAEIKSTGNKI